MIYHIELPSTGDKNEEGKQGRRGGEDKHARASNSLPLWTGRLRDIVEGYNGRDLVEIFSGYFRNIDGIWSVSSGIWSVLSEIVGKCRNSLCQVTFQEESGYEITDPPSFQQISICHIDHATFNGQFLS